MVVGSLNFLRAQSGKSLPADGTRFPRLVCTRPTCSAKCATSSSGIDLTQPVECCVTILRNGLALFTKSINQLLWSHRRLAEFLVLFQPPGLCQCRCQSKCWLVGSLGISSVVQRRSFLATDPLGLWARTLGVVETDATTFLDRASLWNFDFP